MLRIDMIWQMRSECPLTLGEYRTRVVFQIPFCSLTLMDLTVRYSTAAHIRNPVCLLVYTSHLTLCRSDVRACVYIDWEIWTSALVTTTEVRDLLISSVRKYAADGESSQPLGDWYETSNGAVEGFRARPVVGGHLALVSVY